jgi:glycine/D-amino acid oxidase-like deaminating enzyme
MNIQASEPVAGFPIDNPTKSYWQTPPLPISDHRTTPHLPSKAEYCIVGSGITGASIAYKLLNANPTAQILMLEGRTACSGATGRNGGHCRAGRYLSFADDLAKWGAEEALKLEALERATVQNVAQLARDLNIPCDLVELETADVFMDPAQWEAALASLKAREEVLAGLTSASMPEEMANETVRHKYKIWHAEEAREKLLFPKALGAIAYQAYTLSPYKLVCSLLEYAVRRGLNLQTNTMVTSIDSLPASTTGSQRRWTIRTARGDVQVNNVILATNAYTGALYSPLASFIIPTRGQLAVVRPGSKISGSPVLRRSCGLNDVVASPYYHSRAPGLSGEGDIVMGVYCPSCCPVSREQAFRDVQGSGTI